MAVQVISTVDTKDIKQKMTGKDKRYEINKEIGNKDHPITQIDQSKTCSTRTLIPNKREVEKKDIDDFINRSKNTKDVKQKKSKDKEV